MKNILFATTALIAANAFALPAQAEFEVTVGGFTAFQAAAFDNDTTNNSDRDFQSESEITLHAAATADNGLQYGAHIQLNTSTSDSTNSDTVSLYLAGGWGRVVLGDDAGANDMAVSSPTVGIGQINGSYDDYIPFADRGHARNDRGDARFTSFDSHHDTKILYVSPKFAGFQVGVSYAPEVSDNGESVVFTTGSNFFDDIVETAISYEMQCDSGVSAKLAANYNFGNATAGSLQDVSTWTLGAQLGYSGFRFGGGYTHDGNSAGNSTVADDSVTTWNLGATYENGPWGVGVSYLDRDFETNGDITQILGSDGNGGSYTAWAVGGTYTLAPGLTVNADLAFYDRNRAVGTDTDGYVLVTDITAAF